MSLDLINIIFGMKVRQARLEAGLTLADLARQSELSPSYLTEIEKGRKYPRADKIVKMAAALGKPYDDLVSIKLDPSLRYLESTIASSMVRRFPFEEFGLEPADAMGLVTREPERASALLHAVVEMTRRYDLKEEEFLRAALRAYQEIHENYFPELEEAAQAFTTAFGPRYGIDDTLPIPLPTLAAILREEYDYTIDDHTLAASEELRHYRTLLLPGRRPQLFINNRLYARQVRFLLAREIGYRHLGLKERSLASTADEVNSFQQLLNDARAAYFGGALLMPRDRLLSDLQQFLALPAWAPEPFSAMLSTYDVTPEMLLYRFSELIPQFFGLKLHFLRFHHADGADDYQLVRHLNMNQLLVPSGIGLHEHHCRRWLSIRLLPDSAAADPLPVGVQLSEFLETGERFLCIGFGRRMVLSPGVSSSVIIGFRVDSELQHTIGFLDDPAIPHTLIHETCERCPLRPDQCAVRAAPPTILNARREQLARKMALDQLQTRANATD
ncbi:MAG: helix-turn-helix domain-containing protein [Anaerolineae bacterium]|uniref:helix-turn-helix domain-containing protein n=1 Tax=Promineifilum sp. TaxID=2664178 RepID=UPI001DDE6138|nr:helix-turn-helix domain-containing protein [Anaerolineales bacterium]MCB8934325.1 helix-turn-helix domain-containing protein [Promineifilum sp.]MCO5180348.1 helix-turn-helix domain-containing protein [Promineifilum sp.]MCW5846608.1 helix-turn-helix domain-containing protein [Anaerolineae bacterium]